MAGRITIDQYEELRQRLMPPLPAYQAAQPATIETPIAPTNKTVTEASSSTEGASISNTSPTHPNPRAAEDYDRFFQRPESSSTPAGELSEASTSSSSSTVPERPSSPPITAEASSPRSSSNSAVIPEASPSSGRPTYAEVARPSSPTGSDDSSETVTRYTNSEGEQRFIIRNNP